MAVCKLAFLLQSVNASRRSAAAAAVQPQVGMRDAVASCAAARAFLLALFVWVSILRRRTPHVTSHVCPPLAGCAGHARPQKVKSHPAKYAHAHEGRARGNEGDRWGLSRYGAHAAVTMKCGGAAGTEVAASGSGTARAGRAVRTHATSLLLLLAAAMGTCAAAPCAAGTYERSFYTNHVIIVCEPCRAGTFSAEVGAASSATCQPCPAGSYGNVTGASFCRPCDAGTISNATGATACVACTVGSAADASRVACTRCLLGSVWRWARRRAPCAQQTVHSMRRFLPAQGADIPLRIKLTILATTYVVSRTRRAMKRAGTCAARKRRAPTLLSAKMDRAVARAG